jgi:S-layer homology domain.
MKKMKQWLSRLVMLACVLSLLGSAAQAAVYDRFPDVLEDADYAYAVNSLVELGVFTGDENGRFNPDNTITRAEFATIMVRLLGEEERAKTVSASNFSDVPASHWANGYIAIAVEYGLVSGYGNGKFGPGDTLTYEQAVAVLVRHMGLGDQAQLQGGWPKGFMAVADDIGILERTVTTKLVLTRDIVAVLVYNSIYYLEKIN